MHSKIRIVFLSITILFSSLALARSEGTLPELVNPGFVEQPGWFKPSFFDLSEDIAEAASENKRVVFFFYQDGCPYCKKLVTVNFTQKAIVDKTRQNFDVISLNMWGDREVTDFDGSDITEKKYAEKMRVMFTPTVIFLDEKGKPALRLNGYYPPEKFNLALDYASKRLENTMSFRDYLSQNSPEKSRGELTHEDYFLNTPYQLPQFIKPSAAKSSKKFTMLLFEQKNCPACDELHDDILKRPESILLAKKFNIVQLDMWSKDSLHWFDGKKMSTADLANKLNIQYTPSFIFFDQSGKEVMRMEAYLKAFHVQSVMDYVDSGAYIKEPSFQRYIDVRADAIRDRGIKVKLMN